MMSLATNLAKQFIALFQFAIILALAAATRSLIKPHSD